MSRLLRLLGPRPPYLSPAKESSTPVPAADDAEADTENVTISQKNEDNEKSKEQNDADHDENDAANQGQGCQW